MTIPKWIGSDYQKKAKANNEKLEERIKYFEEQRKSLKRSQSELDKSRLNSMVSAAEREIKEFTAVWSKVGMGNSAPDYLYLRVLEAAEQAELGQLKRDYEALVKEVMLEAKKSEKDADKDRVLSRYSDLSVLMKNYLKDLNDALKKAK